jgi:peroxiredoxin
MVFRFSMYVEEGIIKVCNLSEAEGDPAGDSDPKFSCVEQMLADLEEIL